MVRSTLKIQKKKISVSRTGITAGESNPNFIEREYHFVNDNGSEVKCTMYELRIKYKLNSSHLSSVVSGKRNMHGGWRLKGKNEK